jgi:parallel beta-helix repeat protein
MEDVILSRREEFLFEKTFSPAFIALLFASMVTFAFNALPVKAVAQTIYINADGCVTPVGAPIVTSDKITYTFTGDISYPTYSGIIVQRTNIVIDGKGHIVQGNGGGDGLSLTNINKVTIKNTNVQGFNNGIYLYSSSYNAISGNSIAANPGVGIHLDYSSNYNSINSNNIANNNYGIVVGGSFNNSISGNGITVNSQYGIYLGSSSSNSISGNRITGNLAYGIVLSGSSSNKIYHNNMENVYQVKYEVQSKDVWDNGYPSGGNFWSDYTGTDSYSGPGQNIPGSDGIGDTPYVIDANNRDNYPLMAEYVGICDIAVTNVLPCKSVICQGFSLLVNVTVANQGDYGETFDVTLYANKTTILTQTASLPNGNVAKITFTWNTSGFAKGNYTISAYATPVPGETNTTNNTFADDTIQVTKRGDLNGDNSVDVLDLLIVAKALGTHPGDAKYNPNSDINGDGEIDVLDLIWVAKYLGT